ncbi:MAG: alpha-ribazole kinase [Clostridium sp.]
MGYKGRDVEVVQIDHDISIVTACDSCGGIGIKENDVVKFSPYIVGRFTTRVALMEVLSINAIPKTMSIAICNESSPTGDEIISGVLEELKATGLESLSLAISTEKNIQTSQTALGATVIGICKNENIRVTKSKAEDFVYCVGIPKVGNEINGLDDVDIVQIKDVKELLKLNGVSDIVPIGSKGILKEIELLCRNVDCKFIYNPEKEIEIYKSAGPSTCVIFTASEGTDFSGLTLKPIKLGVLKNL